MGTGAAEAPLPRPQEGRAGRGLCPGEGAYLHGAGGRVAAPVLALLLPRGRGGRLRVQGGAGVRVLLCQRASGDCGERERP